MGKTPFVLAAFLIGAVTLSAAQSSIQNQDGYPSSNSSTNCALTPDVPECQGFPGSQGSQGVTSLPLGSLGGTGSGGVVDLNEPAGRDGRGPQSRQGGMEPGTSEAEAGASRAGGQREQPSQQLPPEPENDFQNFVRVDTGQALQLFGYQFFRNVPSTFAPLDRVPVTDQYLIGPGDELLIRVWGQVVLNARMTVDRDGNIYIPRVGAVSVAGVRYDQLHNRISDAIGRYYHGYQVDVSIGRLRSIQVYVAGFARRPGVYTVSALSTLVNALFVSGGPSYRGSMRSIQLKRAGKVVAELDLYEFLLHGDASKDVQLMPEDVIVVPAVGPLVAIMGAVNVPAIYEARDSMELKSLISDAGGLSTIADGTVLRIESIENRKTRTVEEVPYSEEGLKRVLHDGDVVHVLPLSPRIENAVILRGNVAVPGRYPFQPGMRIHDLIPSREFLLTPNFWNRQVAVSREHPYAPPLNAGPTPTPTPPEKTSIRLSAPEINWNYAVIQRINPADLSTRLIPFNLSRALERQDSDDVPLVAGDIVTIFSQRDVAVPRDQQTRFVTVEGEIGAPGVYRLEPGDTLRSVLQRAGGVTSKAYLFGTQLTRESARVEQQRQLDETTDVLAGQVHQRTASDTAGARPEDAGAIAQRGAAQQAMIDRLRSTKVSGRLVLEVKPESNSISGLPEITLEDSDRIIVPQRIEMVHVVGAVYRQSSYVYKPGTNVRHYLRLAGSAMQTADVKRALLVRADGSVLDRRSAGGLWRGGLMDVRVLPGDTVVIPTRLATGAFQRNLRDWTQIASQLAIAGTSLAVIAGL